MAMLEPTPQNNYQADHIHYLRYSFRRRLGKDLVDPALTPLEAARVIYYAPYVVVSHGVGADPIFNYGNQAALQLFAMDWSEFTALPSRQSAELPNQAERAQILATVTAQGFIEHYGGIRIDRTGRRFRIQDVTVWNLEDNQGSDYGQAALYSQWEYI
ncbi:MAG: MEKHLA domain-containing protein [Nodosilinea sp.]